LRRIVAEAGAAPPAASGEPAAKTAATLPPYRTLDGFGSLGAPPANAEPIPDGFAGTGEAAHPPGFYGAAESLVAVNAMAPGDSLAPADYAGLAMRTGGLGVAPPVDLKPWLLLAALVGFLADGLVSLWLARPHSFARRMATLLLALALSGGVVGADRARAQGAGAATEQDMKAALDTHLGYVASGDAEVDETSRLGLSTLAKVLDRRTSAAVAEPIARATNWRSIP